MVAGVTDGAGVPVRLRWRLAEDDGGQPALFGDDELLDRHVGRGEYKGLEFLHVNARRVINEVPAASRMPFRYTINAYRGCTHACAYCLRGDTAILMADGRTRRSPQAGTLTTFRRCAPTRPAPDSALSLALFPSGWLLKLKPG